MVDFQSFGKIARYSKEVFVTEKIDGTNGQIFIQDGVMKVGSRNRWLSKDSDNHGFYSWAVENKEELLKLGEGRHFGEWWGSGIQRRYNLDEKRFSLFNLKRWGENGENAPSCCSVVPLLWKGNFDDMNLRYIMNNLRLTGSQASKGFMNPEGVVIYHTAGNVFFKKTFDKDTGKWLNDN